jgi:hypothetical protein
MSPDIPITTSDFWQNRDELTDEKMAYIFRSATDEEMPMLKERLDCLREAGQVLYEVCCTPTIENFKISIHQGFSVTNMYRLTEIPMQFHELH